MIANANPQRGRDSTALAAGGWLSSRLLGAGIALILAAAGLAWAFGGAKQVDQRFDAAHAPEALVGVVQLLADHEHNDLESYDGVPVAEIATRAEAAFGAELPDHWDDFLTKTSGSGYQRFLASYLVGFAFVVSIALGCLFFVIIQHLTRAGWSVVVRRIAETTAATILPLSALGALIAVPLLFGDHTLFEWNDAELLERDSLLQHKRPYLNPVFFLIRSVVYFGIWSWLAWFFLSRSREQDRTGDAQLTTRMQSAAPLSAIVFAVTVNFFAFDFLMSLAPHWFSAVYGVYYFAGAMVASLSVLIIAVAVLQRFGFAADVTIEHCHDLAKLLFGFVFFWGYIAFSQYLLIWYANIPEETTWYLARQQNGWEWLGLTLVFGHLLIPFLGLMSRSVRRSKRLLVGWSAWLLAMHFVDIYWNVVPNFAGQFSLHLTDILAPAGVSLVFVALLLRTAAGHAWTPQRDPRLPESLALHQV